MTRHYTFSLDTDDFDFRDDLKGTQRLYSTYVETRNLFSLCPGCLPVVSTGYFLWQSNFYPRYLRILSINLYSRCGLVVFLIYQCCFPNKSCLALMYIHSYVHMYVQEIYRFNLLHLEDFIFNQTLIKPIQNMYLWCVSTLPQLLS